MKIPGNENYHGNSKLLAVTAGSKYRCRILHTAVLETSQEISTHVKTFKIAATVFLSFISMFFFGIYLILMIPV